MKRAIFNFGLALEGVAMNKFRAFLTALGIIFGVAAVIAMLAIGNGAKQSILDQMKLIGANSIVIKGLDADEIEEEDTEESSSVSEQNNKKSWSPGLTLNDAESIAEVLPSIEAYSPEIIYNLNVVYKSKYSKLKTVGINNKFFELNNMTIGSGRTFNESNLVNGDAVCIIGKKVVRKFFVMEDPIGKYIKCDNIWMRIIGVLAERTASKESLENLRMRDQNSDVYVPLKTALIRFKDRAKVTTMDLGRRRGSSSNESTNYHQLDRLVIRVNDATTLKASADVIGRLLKRRHRDKIDFEIEIPELLLQQQQKTQETFNFVLAVIAGISLLVGGIGIMNIMLASVLERIKEIGIRRSLGAFQSDINSQFLFESIVISFLGGIVGIFIGVGISLIIAMYAEIPTVISAWSIVVSFGVAFIVGLTFGYYPAQKASKLDPIVALRSD